MPVCGEGESWSSHNIEGFLEKRVKNIKCRNGNFDFLIKHHNSTLSAGSVLTSDVQGSVQKAINRGCPVKEVVARLETLKQLVAGGVYQNNDNNGCRRGIGIATSGSWTKRNNGNDHSK